MQRRSNGVVVPKHKIDTFAVNTDGSGNVDLTMTYIPKSLACIFVESRDDSIGAKYILRKVSLATNVLRLNLQVLQYSRATSTGTTDAAGGGAVAEPHSHTLGYTTTDVSATNPGIVNGLEVSVIYEVA